MITLQLQRAVTTNLTLVQQVAKEHTGLDALLGYVLVVFERREQGSAVFSRLVNSGENFSSRFRIPFRDLSQKYFAIAVNDSVLSYAFEHLIVLEDGSEEFTIKFHLTYRVADPRKVAETLEHDPLSQLREEVVRVIGRNCAKRKAEMFRDRFKDLERIVIDNESVRLRPYAAELGFKIISIDLDKPLPDRQRRVVVDEGHQAQQKRKLREIQTEVIGQALRNVGAGISTPEALREAFEVTREISAGIQPEPEALPVLIGEPLDAGRAGNGAQTRGIDDRAETAPARSSVREDAQQSQGEMWKNESSRLMSLLESAGADPATTARVRENLEAVAAQYFSPTELSNPSVTTPPDEASVFDSVMCSVFAPQSTFIGANIMVQVFAHLKDDSEIGKRLAVDFDDQAKRLSAKPLNNEVRRESKLTFYLSMPGLAIDEPVQELVWRGQPDVVQFGVHVPEDLKEQENIGTIYVSQNGVPFGHAKFLLRIADVRNAVADESGERGATNTWKQYKYAFISYATADRPEVLKRVPMLARSHIEFFQDLLTLEPDEQGEELIYENIDRSDVFFLFWSTAARDSKWVMKEIRYALERKGGDRLAEPEIIPVIIEGPPLVPSPAELKDIHFNDRLIYFMNAQ